MLIKEIAGILLFLIILFLFGQLWFHLIESIVNKVKKLFLRSKETSAWHTFPSDRKDSSQDKTQ